MTGHTDPADEPTLTEAERYHVVTLHDTWQGLAWACTCRAGGSGESTRVHAAAVEHARTHLADRLAQVTAAKDRAEAHVERVRARVEAVLRDYETSCIGGGTLIALVRAALPETTDADSEPHTAPSASREAEVASGGRDESAGLSVAIVDSEGSW